MIIVFYNANEEKVYICDPANKTKVVDADDPDLIHVVPNDDILYVTNGNYLTKQQFHDQLYGKEATDNANPLGEQNNRYTGFLEGGIGNTNISANVQQNIPSHPGRQYIHPTANGVVLIEDIDTPKFPGGVRLEGKWDFIPVDEIGAEVLEESQFFKVLCNNKKVEVVDEKYYQQHAHKKKSKVSPTEAALNKILVQDSTPGAAGKVADGGGLGGADDVAVPIYVE